MRIEAFVEKINSRVAQRGETEKAMLRAEEARRRLTAIFDTVPGSQDKDGRPVTCKGPELEVRKGLKVRLNQTNHWGGPGHTFNIDVADTEGREHGYAQLRSRDKLIMYWDYDDTKRLSGSEAQDSEILEILAKAEADTQPN